MAVLSIRPTFSANRATNKEIGKTMSVLKTILIASCLLLCACQSTGLREITASEPNTAQKEHNHISQSVGEDYSTAQENHLRMYVFTSYQEPDEKEAVRSGYFIDFKTTAAPSQKTTKE